jgi:hypothetical protein
MDRRHENDRGDGVTLTADELAVGEAEDIDQLLVRERAQFGNVAMAAEAPIRRLSIRGSTTIVDNIRYAYVDGSSWSMPIAHS